MWNTHSKPANNNTHTLSCTPRAAATMTAGRFGAWLEPRPIWGHLFEKKCSTPLIEEA